MIEGFLNGGSVGPNILVVDEGILNWNGAAGKTDYLNLNLLIQNGGQFDVSGGGTSNSGGTLGVQGVGELETNNASIYMSSGEINISGGATLWAGSSYKQDGGTLQTTDQYTANLITGSGTGYKAGTITVNGGNISLGNANTFGELDLWCNDFYMSGTYNAWIEGDVTGRCDLLFVHGSAFISETNSTLNVSVYGTLGTGSWTILKSTEGSLNKFGTQNLAGTTYTINNQKSPSEQNPNTFVLSH